jgi:hypothetical protein
MQDAHRPFFGHSERARDTAAHVNDGGLLPGLATDVLSIGKRSQGHELVSQGGTS